DMVERRGTTIFFSTHVMELAERFCDQVAIINRGRLLTVGDVTDLRGQTNLPETASLEDVFVEIVGAHEEDVGLLEWLTTARAAPEGGA
ncbi:MAG: hypothetical protein ACP5GX_11385, partial [Anaerolineae bacterium]